MSKKHSRILKTLLLTLLFSVLCFSATTQAASAKSKALATYRNFLSQDQIDWCESSFMISSSKISFAVVYVDKNSVPELVLYTPAVPHIAGLYSLYTYKKGKVTFVDRIVDGFSYYKKRGVYISEYVGGGSEVSHYYQLKSGKAKEKLIRDKSSFSRSLSYYKAPRKPLSKKSFTSSLKKLTGARAKAVTPTYRYNTPENRAKFLK